MKNIPKTNKICYCLGGKFKTWGEGEISLKALKNTLDETECVRKYSGCRVCKK